MEKDCSVRRVTIDLSRGRKRIMASTGTGQPHSWQKELTKSELLLWLSVGVEWHDGKGKDETSCGVHDGWGVLSWSEEVWLELPLLDYEIKFLFYTQLLSSIYDFSYLIQAQLPPPPFSQSDYSALCKLQLSPSFPLVYSSLAFTSQLAGSRLLWACLFSSLSCLVQTQCCSIFDETLFINQPPLFPADVLEL